MMICLIIFSVENATLSYGFLPIIVRNVELDVFHMINRSLMMKTGKSMKPYAKILNRIKLKPCPFCGREAEFVSSASDGKQVWYVRCPWPDCEVSVEAFDRNTPQEAAEIWNR